MFVAIAQRAFDAFDKVDTKLYLNHLIVFYSYFRIFFLLFFHFRMFSVSARVAAKRNFFGVVGSSRGYYRRGSVEVGRNDQCCFLLLASQRVLCVLCRLVGKVTSREGVGRKIVFRRSQRNEREFLLLILFVGTAALGGRCFTNAKQYCLGF